MRLTLAARSVALGLAAPCALGATGAAREEITRLEAALPGLGARAEASLDAVDVPRIEAADMLDAIRAEGWMHADARFLQMDFTRREASARLSELVPQAIELDRRSAVLGLAAIAERALAALPAGDRAILDAYCEGVNARLAATPLAEYRLLRATPEPWRPVDTLLVQLAMARYLDGSASLDLERGAVARVLPADWAAFLTHRGGVFDQTVDGSAPPAPIAIPEGLKERIEEKFAARRASGETGGGPAIDAGEARDPAPSETNPGSNAFAVAGSRTRDGRAVVGNDMHLSHSAPGFWYRVALAWPGGFLAGVSLPGVPLVVQGTNGHVAWGFTNLTADLADLVLATPSPQDASAGPADEDVVVEIGPASARERVTVRRTPFGPILGRLPDGTPYAWRWALAEEAGVDCGLFRLCFARTVDQALDAAAAWRGPPQNVLVADDEGRIGWTIAGSLPARERRTPVPVTAADAPAWRGLMTAAEKPRIVDPPSGVLTSANQLALVAGGALASVLGGDEAPGDRARRLRELLESRTDWTEPELHAVTLDTVSARLLRWRPIADAALAVLDLRMSADAPDAPSRERIGVERAALRAWDGRVEIESHAPVFLDRFRGALRQLFARALGVPAGSIADDAILRIAEEADRASPVWTGTLSDAARTALDGAFDARGRPIARGDENALVMRHPAADAFGPAARLASMPPTPLPGHPTAVRVQTPNFGASQRSVVSPAHLADGILVTPAGQSGLPASPHFRSLHAPWVRGEPWPLLPGDPARRIEFRPTQADDLGDAADERR
jgi:penicillin amidase